MSITADNVVNNSHAHRLHTLHASLICCSMYGGKQKVKLNYLLNRFHGEFRFTST